MSYKKISDNVYKKRFKALRDNVNFKIDLRKKLTTGKKSAITRAWKDYRQFKNTRQLIITKEKGESNKKYKQRTKSIKTALGQSNSLLKTPYMQAPIDANIEYKNGALQLTKGKVTQQLLPIDSNAFAANPEKYIKQLLKGKTANRVILQHGAYRGKGYGVELYEDMIDDLIDLAEAYEEQLQYVLTGLLIQ